jgi:hypothetical protein
MANLEALWVSGRLQPGKTIVASSQAHYTHGRISEVLGLNFAAIEAAADGRMDVAALEEQLKAGNVGTVVATLGTTGIGAVDPLSNSGYTRMPRTVAISVLPANWAATPAKRSRALQRSIR